MRIAPVVVLGLGLCACKPTPSAAITEPEPATPTKPVIVEAPPPAPACAARTPRGALALIPEGSEWVVHVSPRELLGSPAWSVFEPTLAADADWQRATGVFRACGLELAQIDHALLGFTANEDFVLVLTGPGIGRVDRALCMADEVQARAGAEAEAPRVAAWEVDPSVSIIELSDGRAYLFGDDLLALATSSWAGEIGDLGRCHGHPAIAGYGRELLGRVELDAPVWVAGWITPAIAELLGSTGGVNGLRELALSLRVDAGLAIRLEGLLQDEAGARALADSVRLLESMAGSMPEPALGQMLERMAVEQLGTTLRIETSASVDELRTLIPAQP